MSIVFKSIVSDSYTNVTDVIRSLAQVLCLLLCTCRGQVKELDSQSHEVVRIVMTSRQVWRILERSFQTDQSILFRSFLRYQTRVDGQSILSSTDVRHASIESELDNERSKIVMLVTRNIRNVLICSKLDGCGVADGLKFVNVDEYLSTRLVVVQHLDTSTLSIGVVVELYCRNSCYGQRFIVILDCLCVVKYCHQAVVGS